MIDPRWHVQAVPEVDEDYCLNDEGPWHSTKPVWRWRGEGMSGEDGWWRFTVQLSRLDSFWFNGYGNERETQFKLLYNKVYPWHFRKNMFTTTMILLCNFLFLCIRVIPAASFSLFLLRGWTCFFHTPHKLAKVTYVWGRPIHLSESPTWRRLKFGKKRSIFPWEDGWSCDLHAISRADVSQWHVNAISYKSITQWMLHLIPRDLTLVPHTRPCLSYTKLLFPLAALTFLLRPEKKTASATWVTFQRQRMLDGRAGPNRSLLVMLHQKISGGWWDEIYIMNTWIIMMYRIDSASAIDIRYIYIYIFFIILLHTSMNHLYCAITCTVQL